MPKSYLPFKPQMMNRDSMSAEAGAANPVTAIRDPFRKSLRLLDSEGNEPGGIDGLQSDL